MDFFNSPAYQKIPYKTKLKGTNSRSVSKILDRKVSNDMHVLKNKWN